MTKIEEVARAICRADGVDPDAVGCGLGVQMPKDAEYPLWEARVTQACAAIAALREPNEAMIEAGMAEAGTDLASEYRSMINEILKETEK